MPDIREPRFSYPKSAVMFHRYATVLVGGVKTVQHAASQDMMHYVVQNPGADGDQFSYSFCLAAGLYTLAVGGVRGPACGRVDWYLDGVLAVSGQDWYNVGTAWNTVMTSVVTVVGNGRHTLTGVINGKNVASTGYLLYGVVVNIN